MTVTVDLPTGRKLLVEDDGAEVRLRVRESKLCGVFLVTVDAGELTLSREELAAAAPALRPYL